MDGGKGRGADRTGFSNANIVNSSIISWSGSVDPITVLHLVRNCKIFEIEYKLSNVLPHEFSQKDSYVT